MKKVLLASALLAMVGLVVLLVMGGRKAMLPPTTYTIGGSLATVSGAIVEIDYGPVTGGRVTSSPAGVYDRIDCPPDCVAVYGDMPGWVTLTATPSRGWVFAGWNSSPGCSGTGPCHVWLDGHDGYGWSATFRRR